MRGKVEGLREPSPGNLKGEGEDRTQYRGAKMRPYFLLLFFPILPVLCF